jgi:hypothetical protein
MPTNHIGGTRAGISRPTLYELMDKLGIEKSGVESGVTTASTEARSKARRVSRSFKLNARTK